ncbi:MAG: asparaginase, partial [Planctomycetota bacterium]
VHAPTASAMRKAGEVATPLHNNCSGKHAGMLALSKYLGALGQDYRDIEHPVQQLNLLNLAALAEVAPASIPVAVDGCSVPTFALPLQAAARAFSRRNSSFADGAANTSL